MLLMRNTVSMGTYICSGKESVFLSWDNKDWESSSVVMDIRKNLNDNILKLVFLRRNYKNIGQKSYKNC
jgi:hypothetical protein